MGFKGPTVSVLVAELLQCSDVDISKFEMQQVRLMMSLENELDVRLLLLQRYRETERHCFRAMRLTLSGSTCAPVDA